jgi:signal transduction histidine kinase
MSATSVTSVPKTRSMVSDPVLLLPAIVGVGFAVAWLGLDEEVSGARVAADLSVAWALVASSVLALERVRWRRSRVLLATAAFALLAGDLRWTSSPALWTLGFLLEGLWAALLLHVVLTFPEGRARSSAARIALSVAYTAALGGQAVGALVMTDARDVASITSQPTVSDAVNRAQGLVGIGVALTALVLLIGRLRVLRGPAQRAQAPLLVAACLTVPSTVLWLAWVSTTGEGAGTIETIARSVALLIPLGVVGGILWPRLHRREAAGLVVELQTEGATSLRERLIRVLGDPTLEVAYFLDDGRSVDADGRPFELPQGPDRAVTLVAARGEEVAALVHDPALLDEAALVESVQATAGLVLENERLSAEVRAQLAEVRASRNRLVAVTDAERRRLERNLHDGAQQRLVTLSVALGLEASRLGSAGSDVLSRAQKEVEEAIAELRELARGIHPTLLRVEGLNAAVEALARRTPLPVTVEGTVETRLPGAVELAAYFLVSEALTNVVKHASASEVIVQLEQTLGRLRVAVTDDGVGGASTAPDSGLAGLQDRLEALNARLVVESEPGRGTTIRTEIPCES